MICICISVKPCFFVFSCLKWFSVAPVQELPESLEAQLLLQMRQLRADTRAAETRLKAQEKHHWNRSLSWKFQIHSFPKTAVTKTVLVYLYPRMSTVQVVHKKQPPVLEAHLALLNRILVVQEFKDRVFSHSHNITWVYFIVPIHALSLLIQKKAHFSLSLCTPRWAWNSILLARGDALPSSSCAWGYVIG